MPWSKQWKCCHKMVTGNTFESKVTGRKYHIRNSISWKIKSHIAQEVQPTVCQKDGECAVHQNEWHHPDTRTRKTEKPVAAHFCQLDHTMKDLQVRRIEEIHRSSTQSWRERERASWSSPSERCLHMGWIWISDITALCHHSVCHHNVPLHPGSWRPPRAWIRDYAIS